MFHKLTMLFAVISTVGNPEGTAAGVAKVFTPGATTQEIIDWVRANVTPRE